MSSKVYMIDLSARSHKENKMAKLQKLFDAVGMGDCIKEKDLTAVRFTLEKWGLTPSYNQFSLSQLLIRSKKREAIPS